MFIVFDEKPVNRSQFVQMSKEAFHSFMRSRNNHVLIEHLRKRRTKMPIGALVSFRDDEGTLRFGWSLRRHSKKINDPHIKYEGFIRAINRAVPLHDLVDVPPSVKFPLDRFILRSHRYFRAKDNCDPKCPAEHITVWPNNPQ